MRRRLAVLVLLLSLGLLAGIRPATRPAAAAELAEAPAGSAKTVEGRKGTYDDFSNLRVTVSQTAHLTNQAVTVTWTGGTPTPRNRLLGVDYLQVMQCWGLPGQIPGDPADLAFRETCQFGSQLDPPNPFPFGGSTGLYAGFRSIASNAQVPREPDEPLPPDAKMVPFRTAAGTRTADGSSASRFPQVTDPASHATREAVDAEVLADYFTRFTTNEVPFAVTAADGSGRVNFELQNAIRAPHLGCGEQYTDPNGQSQPARPCQLVIVPRGAHDPYTGADVSQTGAVNGSPFMPSVWRNRITVELSFDPVAAVCPLGQEERRTAGTELVAEAITSWQPALCANNGPVFGYASTGDSEAARQVVNPSAGAPGLVFSSDPVVSQPGEPAVVQAPVTLSGAVIAINIDARLDPNAPLPANVDIRRGQPVPEIKLNQRLVAKLLTQSYQRDTPGGRQADYLAANPISLREDPEFLELNQEYDDIFAHWDQTPNATPDGLMVSIGNYNAAREVWRWILADPQARDWVTGKTDDGFGMKVNKYYQDLFSAAPDSFPKADPSCAVNPVYGEVSKYCTLDLRPYQNTLSAAAYQTLRADAAVKITWDPLKVPPGLVADPPKAPGFRWAMAITDAASAARYGLFTARLRNHAGEYVKPTTESLLAGAAAMVPTDVADVRAIDPEKNAAGGYPLTMVTYAAADTSEPADARKDYANLLRYAAGPGQQPGEANGQLPEGYVPLPQDMREQTLRAADTLERWAVSPSPTPGGDGGGSTTGNNNGSGGTATTPPATTPPAAGPTGTPAAGARPVAAPARPPASPAPSVRPVGQPTPGSPLGSVRWLLLGALVAGLAGAAAAPILHRIAERQSRKDGTRTPG
jgi:hypothetical protein